MAAGLLRRHRVLATSQRIRRNGLARSAWVDQSLLGLTSVFRPTLVNDLRFSYFFSSTSETAPEERDCPGCLGIGAPAINIPQAGLFIGNSSSNYNLGRRFHLSDIVTWQRATHRVRFGVEWEYNRGGILGWANEPATLTLFSPAQARQNNLPLPAAFRTIDDILQLPLRSVTVSVGDPRVPQEDGGSVRHWPTARLFVQDTWRVRPGLTVNYGLGWSIDRDLNYDLRKPALFAPLLGNDGLGPPRKSWRNFSPVLGLAWAPASLAKTVIRAGAGLYYEPLTSPGLDAERATLGPPGLGRQTFLGNLASEHLAGYPRRPCWYFAGLPQSNLVHGRRPDDDSASHPERSRPESGQGRSDGSSDPAHQASVRNRGISFRLQDFVCAARQRGCSARDRPRLRFERRFCLQAFRASDPGRGESTSTTSTASVVQSFPTCTATQENDPQAICSRGPINVQEWQGRATYKGLLLRADKRFSHGFQVLGSYAYSSNTGTNNGNGFNLDNWLQNRGPLPNDYTNILNLAAVAQLPRRFELGLNFSYSSAPPFSAYVGGIDFNGDGTTGDLLPGTTVNAFNRGMGRADLEQLVTQFNSTYALHEGCSRPRDSRAWCFRPTMPSETTFIRSICG